MNVMNSPAEGIFIRKSSRGGSFLFRNRSIGRTGIQRKSRMSRKAEGKIEEVKWKRRSSETFAIAVERGRRGISISPWDREEIFGSSKTRKIATVSTGKDDDGATRATELGKESPTSLSTSPMKLPRFTSPPPFPRICEIMDNALANPLHIPPALFPFSRIHDFSDNGRNSLFLRCLEISIMIPGIEIAGRNFVS